MDRYDIKRQFDTKKRIIAIQCRDRYVYAKVNRELMYFDLCVSLFGFTYILIYAAYPAGLVLTPEGNKADSHF